VRRCGNADNALGKCSPCSDRADGCQSNINTHPVGWYSQRCMPVWVRLIRLKAGDLTLPRVAWRESAGSRRVLNDALTAGVRAPMLEGGSLAPHALQFRCHAELDAVTRGGKAGPGRGAQPGRWTGTLTVRLSRLGGTHKVPDLCSCSSGMGRGSGTSLGVIFSRGVWSCVRARQGGFPARCIVPRLSRHARYGHRKQTCIEALVIRRTQFPKFIAACSFEAFAYYCLY